MILLYILSILTIWLTFWSLIPRDEWWFRGADFPRLQLLSLGAICLISCLLFIQQWHIYHISLIIGLVCAIAYQIKMVIPYTFLWKKQVKSVHQSMWNVDKQISLLVSNVLTPNQDYHKLLAHIQQYQPDIVLTLESDLRWQQALTVIEPNYPYQVKVPLDNLYGMHLYSKLEIIHHQVDFLLSDEIPSIHAKVKLACGKPVHLYCLHPQPPSPTEAKESTLRDAELLIVGKQVQAHGETCIVMGDLNDVAWSKTTQLFQRISGLLDPRIGRRFLNTFHADLPFLRWSLDHIFHSADFGLVKIQRLSHIGSDHFPVYTVLQFDGLFEIVHEQPEQHENDIEIVEQKIEQGIEKAEQENQQD